MLAGAGRPGRGASSCGCLGPCSPRQDRTSSFSVLETTLEISRSASWLDVPTCTNGAVRGLCRKSGLLVGREAEGRPLACAAPSVASERAAGSQALPGPERLCGCFLSVVGCAGWQLGSLLQKQPRKNSSASRGPQRTNPQGAGSGAAAATVPVSVASSVALSSNQWGASAPRARDLSGGVGWSQVWLVPGGGTVSSLPCVEWLLLSSALGCLA